MRTDTDIGNCQATAESTCTIDQGYLSAQYDRIMNTTAFNTLINESITFRRH